MADIIFGDVSPSGKLPVTIPRSINQLPDYADYSMEGRTYKYMKESPLYPFGYGLGYAEMTWSAQEAFKTTIKKDDNLEISVTVDNIGPMAGDEVFQVYVKLEDDMEGLPLASLVDFKRITVPNGEQRRISFNIPHRVFSYYDDAGLPNPYIGKAKIIVSNASPGKRSVERGAKKVEFAVKVE